jgi:hypothetical protein
MRYTYDEDDDEDSSEGLDTRRSTRNSGAMTPADNAGPTVTLSGRQVRSRLGGVYGESLLSGQNTDTRSSPATDASEGPVRASRSGLAGHSRRRVDDDGETSSEEEWDGGDEDEPDEVMGDIVDENRPSEGDDESDEDMEPKSLVVTLRYGQGRSPSVQHTSDPATSVPSKPVSALPQAAPVHTNVAQQPTRSETNLAIPTIPTANGYLTPSSTNNSVNGTAQSAPRAPATPSSNGLPPGHNAAAAKQTQLPFQPIAQHTLKPTPPPQPQHHPLPQYLPYQQPAPQKPSLPPPP